MKSSQAAPPPLLCSSVTPPVCQGFAYPPRSAYLTVPWRLSCLSSLQALCAALEVPMEVFSAMSPPLLLGGDYEGTPLLLTYHEHYYALGAHYNSVVPA